MTVADGWPTVDEYQDLRQAAGWPELSAAVVERALPGSLCAVVVRDEDGRLCGTGRVVGDGALYFYLQDVLVRESRRNQGVGRLIVEALLDRIRRQAGAGAFVGLMAAHGSRGFYERQGFSARPEDRPGMFMTIR